MNNLKHFFLKAANLKNVNAFYWVSFVCVLLFVFDNFVKPLTWASMTLVGIACAPWLIRYFDVQHLPFGIKLNIEQLEKAGIGLQQAGLVAEPNSNEQPAYLQIADKDPNLALAGLRIELEKSLRKLERHNEVDSATRRAIPLHRLMNILVEREVISSQERSALSDLLPMLNKAAHGANIEGNAYEWAMDFGPKLIAGLNSKLSL